MTLRLKAKDISTKYNLDYSSQSEITIISLRWIKALNRRYSFKRFSNT